MGFIIAAVRRLFGRPTNSPASLGSHSASTGLPPTEGVGGNATVPVGQHLSEVIGTTTGHTVGGNRSESVGSQSGVTVHGDRTESVSSQSGVRVGSNRSESVGSQSGVTVHGDRTESVGGGSSGRKLARGALLGLLGALLTLGLVIGAVVARPWQGLTPLSATGTTTGLTTSRPTLVPTPLVTPTSPPTTPPAPTHTPTIAPTITPTATPQPAPQLSVSPTGEQDITCGAEPFTYPTVTVRNTGGGTLTWTVTASNAQVAVTPASGDLTAGQAQILSTTQTSGGLGTDLTVSANGSSAKVSFVCIPG